MHQSLLHVMRRAQSLVGSWAGLLSAGLLLASLGAQAQTTTTVFNEDFEGTTNSFTLENGNQANQWFVGTAGGNGPTATGSKAAYITNDGGTTSAYMLTAASVTHLYRDVTFPAGQSVIQLSFDWRAGGESTFDYLLVQVAPTSFTPVAGTLPATTSVTVLAQLNLQAAFGRTTLQLPASFAGSTQRLIFTWRNDASLGTQPGVIIDNVTSTARVANALSGAYTINNALPTAGTNFTSFSDAASRLNGDGISGPVTLTVSGGPYTEQFLLNQVNGVSATNTIVVNGNGRTIQFASASSSQRAVVQLNGTSFTTINNLVIDATGGTTGATYGYGVLLTNAANNDKITNNIVNADITATSSNFTGIAVSGSTTSPTTSGNSANSLLIEGNTVNGGYYGITLYGSSTTALNTGNIVRNNQLRDFYVYGLYVGYQDGAQLVGNDISRPLRTNPNSYYGIYAFGARNLAIEKNRLHDPFTGNPTANNALYGIYLATSNTSSLAAPNDVVNNVLYNLNGNNSQYLIYTSGGSGIRIYNNSINSDDQTATTTAIVYGIYSSGADNDIENNAISITRSGPGIKYGLAYTVARTISNRNDIYVPGGNVGYYSTAFTTLANWQTANGGGFDQNSVSADPIFANPSAGNLTPSNVALNNVAAPLSRVTDDITGALRSSTPDIGAYEFTPVAIDLAPVALLGPAAGATCYSAAEPVIVQVRNNGSANLSFATNPATVTVVATPPGGATQTFTTTVSTGTLSSAATQNLTLPGTLNMTTLGTYSFAITATVTGDANPSNDVLAPAATRAVVAPVAGALTPTAAPICVSGSVLLALTGSANGNLQYQSSPNGTTFTDIAGATSATYNTPVLTSTTYYRVRTTCNANTVYSNVSTITVNNPQVATTNTPISICPGATATLTATASAGSQVRFFSSSTGGTALNTAPGSYTTPALTASTTYYAEAYTGGQENVGKPSTNGADLTNLSGGLYFTTNGPVTIANVTVYRTANAAAGTATIYLLTGSTTTTTSYLATATVNVPANTSASVSPTVLTLNFAVLAAGSYTLYLSTATPNLIRDYSTAALPATAYPYTSPSGLVTITGGTLSGYYYFFYNWQTSTECISSARTSIQVNVTPGPAPTLTATTQANGAILLSTPTVAGATYQFFKNGAAVAAASASPTLTLLSSAQNGSYTVVVTPPGSCASAPSAPVNVTVLSSATASLTGVYLRLYPNPTPDGTFTLELAGPRATTAQLSILGALGQEVQRGTLPAGTTTLHLPGLAAGIYTLRLQTPQGVLTQRFVRE